MDIQQLTLVISLVKDIADGALWAFVIYLLVAHVLPYVVAVVVCFLVFRFLVRWVNAYFQMDWFEQMAHSMGQPLYQNYSWLDVAKTKELLVKHLSATALKK